MPKLESLTVSPHICIASGAEVIDQIHHGIGDDAAKRGGDEPRLPRDLEQRPAAMHVRRRRLRRIDPDNTAIATSATTACIRKLKANR